MFGAYVVSLPWLGFRVSTFLFVAAPRRCSHGRATRRAGSRCSCSRSLTAAVVYFVFEHYLLVLLPRGRWTGF